MILWSTGRKLVSFLPSNPTPNSISGKEQEPKLPMPVEAAGPIALTGVEGIGLLEVGNCELIIVNKLTGLTNISTNQDELFVPNGKVLACSPLLTVLCKAGSKKRSGSLAGSWAWTSPFSSRFLGVFWQNTELRSVGGLVEKSCSSTSGGAGI